MGDQWARSSDKVRSRLFDAEDVNKGRQVNSGKMEMKRQEGYRQSNVKSTYDITHRMWMEVSQKRPLTNGKRRLQGLRKSEARS